MKKAEMLYRVREANNEYRYLGPETMVVGNGLKQIVIQLVAEGSLETVGRYVNPAFLNIRLEEGDWNEGLCMCGPTESKERP